MTDDIVTQLRGQISNEFVIDYPNLVRVPTLYEQAADEIERLRRTMQLMSIDYRTQIAGLKMRCKCGADHA